ncbi:unnamed protein product [Didymodactylos carnosus]|uniref:NAD(+)--protein-arginine ADP-ribosyltransferase n=1 Tax=Didymodactylos carnosus TaxID=1234261 RepID=A0A8S2EVS7_9BILA|nr:unnamed protein product [Didymodactylos carnosus]CAF4060188.1 unnamed protein product [Didymodactylos carnosus]
MMTNEFDKVRANVGGFLSMNSFLSTSKNRNVALSFAQQSTHRPHVESVLFEIGVDTRRCPRSFHNIEKISFYETEGEILFSMGTVFRIASVDKLSGGMWNVKLILNGDEDVELRRLTDHMKKEIDDRNDVATLGTLVMKMGEYEKAEEFYLLMLETGSQKDSDVAAIYNQLGLSYDERGNNEQALVYYNKGLDIYQKCLPADSLSLATTYSNIGNVYSNKGDFDQALMNLNKALQIQLKTLSADHPSAASTYNNIGVVYDKKKQYDRALEYYHKCLKIRQAVLPQNHPLLATAYNNIGVVHVNRGDGTRALKYYAMSLQIRLRSLPQNHLSLRVAYWNNGMVYYAQQKWKEALTNFTLALD